MNYHNIIENIFDDILYLQKDNIKHFWKKEDSKYSLELKLPGYTKENLNIKHDKDILYVEAKSEKYGNFKRILNLPNDIQNIKAKLENGILQLSGEIPEEKKASKVEWI